jgi:signal transduction histidine kinase
MENIGTKRKRRWVFAGLRVALALAIAFFICQLQLDYIEGFFYDLRIRVRPEPKTSGQIALIAIDTKTQEVLKRLPEAADFSLVFKQLETSNPRHVLYADDFMEVMGSYEQLEEVAENAKKVNFMVLEDRKLPEKGLEDEFRLLPPLQDIPVKSSPKTMDLQNFAKDGVTRRMIFDLEGTPLAHMTIAQEYNGLTRPDQYRGYFKMKRTNQAYVNYHTTGFYNTYSFIDVQEGRVSPDVFKDKIVIIGRDTRSDAKDYLMTPYSRDILAMPRFELHANILDTMIENDAPIKSPNWLTLLITCCIAVLTVFVVLTLRPGRGLFILGLTLGAYTIATWLAFLFGEIWIDYSHPLFAIFICYYFFIPYRLIIENRRSWEYFQRNSLLTQVEELKSNFLRMMSHDLKTPLARIQGMTELALRDNNTLSPKQQDALRTINQSSEELTEFVGSILDLGRIESKEIKLQLKSKDINALLTEVVQKLDYFSKQKNITVVTEFEPMFSVKVDEDLMRQVFYNLVENAIKYSPEGSSILVSTDEVDGRVVVQVADQGMGIPADEIGNLFMKFYRSRTVREGAIKGSGLGLYLARYFVDLHAGQISVESEKNKGSTFTVELPMNL